MSKNYTANQFELTFSSRALQNWEVPKFQCKRPYHRSGKTRIVANSRGHLLPGVPKTCHSPWGNFLGTWHMPLRISRQHAEELNGITAAKERLLKCVRHAVFPPHLIVHELDGAQKDEKIEKQEAKKYKKEGSKVEIPTATATDDPELLISQNKETEAKILCPIHDLYQEP